MQNENNSTETLTGNPGYLRKTIHIWPKLDKHMTFAAISGNRLNDRPWYIALWRICTIALMETVCGISLGLVMLVIAHYTGIEAWMNSMKG